MFRAELKQLGDGSILKMEGRLVGDWANEAKSLLAHGPIPKGLMVDLAEVTYIDTAGEQVLTWLNSVGAKFLANGVYASAVCKRLKLPLHNKASRMPTVFRTVLATQEGSD